MKEIHAVGAVVKSLGIFRKAFKLEDTTELTLLLPLDGQPATAIPPAIEKKYHISRHRLDMFSKMPEILAILHLLHVMKLIDSKNYKEVALLL